jgi:hypothetical protein
MLLLTPMSTMDPALSSQPASPPESPKHLELPVEELLRRARPLPPHEALVIDDVDEEEGRAFLAAVEE